MRQQVGHPLPLEMSSASLLSLLNIHSPSFPTRAIKYVLFYMDMFDIGSRAFIPWTLIAASGDVSWHDPHPMGKRLWLPLAGWEFIPGRVIGGHRSLPSCPVDTGVLKFPWNVFWQDAGRKPLWGLAWCSSCNLSPNSCWGCCWSAMLLQSSNRRWEEQLRNNRAKQLKHTLNSLQTVSYKALTEVKGIQVQKAATSSSKPGNCL